MVIGNASQARLAKAADLRQFARARRPAADTAVVLTADDRFWRKADTVRSAVAAKRSLTKS